MRGLTLLAVAASAMLAAGCDAPDEDPRTNDPTTTASDLSPSTSAPGPVTTSAPATSLTPLPQFFDHAAVQDAVHKVLTTSYRVENLGVVICPPERPVKAGTTFHCTATIDGERKKIRIRVTSDDGDYTVGRPD